MQPKAQNLLLMALPMFTFNTSGLSIDHTVYVVENNAESLILDSDFLSDKPVIMDYSSKIVS